MFPVAAGATSLEDVRIGLRVLDYVISPADDRKAIGVIFDPRIKESVDDTLAIVDWVSSSAGHGGWTVSPVEMQKLSDAKGLKAVIIANGMASHYDRVAAYGRETGTVVISSDLVCVRSAKCTVGIATAPRVEVVVSFEEAHSSGIQFSEAFRMMVTEY